MCSFWCIFSITIASEPLCNYFFEHNHKHNHLLQSSNLSLRSPLLPSPDKVVVRNTHVNCIKSNCYDTCICSQRFLFLCIYMMYLYTSFHRFWCPFKTIIRSHANCVLCKSCFLCQQFAGFLRVKKERRCLYLQRNVTRISEPSFR